jgi:fructokinase
MNTAQSHCGNTTNLQVATAGEALIDLIEDADGRLRPCAGGAVYNATRALALQGVGTLYLNPLSNDRFGQLLADGIRQAGVTLAHPEPVALPTSLAVVGLDGDGKASYSFYRKGVADRHVNAAQLEQACQPHNELRIVATGCLALVAQDQPKYLPWLRSQRHAGRLVVVDANLRPAIVSDMAAYRASVRAALGQAHLIKVSDDDLLTLGTSVNESDPDPLTSARALLAETPAQWLALTLGARGAMLLRRDGRAWHSAERVPVKVVDTVGAGDCFLAGLLVALLGRPSFQSANRMDELALSDEDIKRLLSHAVASASLCVQQTGCVPPSLAQVNARLTGSPPTFRMA